jgi:hypothetical protein
MNASQGSNDTTKFWTILLIMLLAVAVTVTLIDLGIKASILAESNSLKLRIEEWEVQNGQKAVGRNDERNHSNGRFNSNLSGDVLGADDAGMEARDAIDRIANTIPERPRKRNIPRPSDGD